MGSERCHGNIKVRRFRPLILYHILTASSYAFICAVNTNSGYNSLDKVWSGPRMTNIWLVASNPSDGNQLFPLTATVTNGTGAVRGNPALLEYH